MVSSKVSPSLLKRFTAFVCSCFGLVGAKKSSSTPQESQHGSTGHKPDNNDHHCQVTSSPAEGVGIAHSHQLSLPDAEKDTALHTAREESTPKKTGHGEHDRPALDANIDQTSKGPDLREIGDQYLHPAKKADNSQPHLAASTTDAGDNEDIDTLIRMITLSSEDIRSTTVSIKKLAVMRLDLQLKLALASNNLLSSRLWNVMREPISSEEFMEFRSASVLLLGKMIQGYPQAQMALEGNFRLNVPERANAMGAVIHDQMKACKAHHEGNNVTDVQMVFATNLVFLLEEVSINYVILDTFIEDHGLDTLGDLFHASVAEEKVHNEAYTKARSMIAHFVRNFGKAIVTDFGKFEVMSRIHDAFVSWLDAHEAATTPGYAIISKAKMVLKDALDQPGGPNVAFQFLRAIAQLNVQPPAR